MNGISMVSGGPDMGESLADGRNKNKNSVAC